MEFNPAPSSVVLMDINSCFATIEQQANPYLRGKPVAVAAFTTSNGCILAASVDAKRLGIKTGMRVRDGKSICPKLVVLPPDPWKYRNIHLKLKRLLENYSPEVIPKSIDEFVLKPMGNDLWLMAKEIKQRIKQEVGDYITVSIGIAPNRYLAKVAAGLVKPDGLVEINKNNFLEVYRKLKLTDLTGIKVGNATRLNSMGIYTVLDFYNSPIWKLKAAFHSITGLYWYTRLHGYEVDEVDFGRKSFGNEVAVNLSSGSDASSIVARLIEKADSRVRVAGFRAGKMRVEISTYKIAVVLYDLTQNSGLQLDFFGKNLKKENLGRTVNEINQKWGSFVIGSARGFMAKDIIKDRIGFGQL